MFPGFSRLGDITNTVANSIYIERFAGLECDRAISISILQPPVAIRSVS